MTRLSSATLALVAATVIAVGGAASAQAQCAGCGTQTVFSPVIAQPQATVAFSPVVAAPTFVASPVIVQQPRQGWYPGRWFDQRRMERWGVSNTAWVQPQTVAFAPAPVVQTVGFAPTASVQTVNFAPSASYVTAYAPMQRTVVGFAPTATTVFSPAVIEPVVSSGCSTCSTCATVATPCSACAGSTTVVEQAAFTSPVTTVAPASGCSSCAEGSGVPTYYSQPAAASAAIQQAAPANQGPETPQPELATEPAPPASSQQYGAQRPASAPATGNSATPKNGSGPNPPEESVIEPKALPDEEATTGPENPSTFQAPPLLGPQNDRTANRPTVDIHDAVYRQPARKATVGTTTVAKPLTPTSTGAPQTDANGWYSVSER